MNSTLSANHIRSISASITVIKKLKYKISINMTNPVKGCYESTGVNIPDEGINHNKKTIEKIRKFKI